MTSDPLLPILHATAQLLLSRPGLAGQRHSPERFVVEHRQLITGALLKSPVLRNKIRNGVRARRDEPDLQAAMTLILAADEETVRAGLRLLDQLAKEKTSRQTLRSRQQQRLSEFRNRLEIAKGRAEHSGMALQAADTALSDVTQRAEELETEVAALQRRLHDPRILASNLLTALQRSSDSPQEGPEAVTPATFAPGSRRAQLLLLRSRQTPPGSRRRRSSRRSRPSSPLQLR